MRAATRMRRREHGGATVEFVLAIPVLLIFVAGSLYVGRMFHARARVVDAVGYATRAEAIAASGRPACDPQSGAILAAINGKMASSTDCELPIQVQVATNGSPPYRHLDVTAICTMKAPLLGGLLSPDVLKINRVSASASMPLDCN